MFHRFLLVCVFLLSACANHSIYTDPAEPKKSTATAEQVQQRIEKVLKPTPASSEKKPLQDAQKPIAAPPANPLGLHKLSLPEATTSSEKALGWLKNGNTRYLKGSVRADGTKQSDRERIAKGQKPHTVILSCSDSRVPPEVIFDQKLGELLTVRTAGPSLDNSAVATIEYALTNLGTKLIVILGHDACGFVKNALSENLAETQSSFMSQVLNDIRPRLISFRDKTPSKNFVEEGWANVHGIGKDLVERSQIVRDAVLSGEVKIQPALYLLRTGQVEWATKN